MENEHSIAELMGSVTTDAEARAMVDILTERGLDAAQMSDEEFFALIPEAITRGCA
jgi:hypothetical protein